MSVCFYCEGTGLTEDVPAAQHRVLPPDVAQGFHLLLQEHFPDHDQVECHCCCIHCPGWTEDRDIMTPEEIADIIPVHNRDWPMPAKGFFTYHDDADIAPPE